jgi:hypothetical protein
VRSNRKSRERDIAMETKFVMEDIERAIGKLTLHPKAHRHYQRAKELYQKALDFEKTYDAAYNL